MRGLRLGLGLSAGGGDEASPVVTLVSLPTNMTTWSPGLVRSTITLNATGPSGTPNTAYTLQSTNIGISQNFFIQNTTSVPTSTEVTVRVNMKSGTWTWGAIRVASFTTPTDGFTYYDLTNGVVGTNPAGRTASMTSLGSGWYQCDLTFTTDASDALGTIFVYGAIADNDVTEILDGTQNILVQIP